MMRYNNISPTQRFRILARDNFTCQYCGAQVPDAELQVDHIEPSSKAGNNYDTNLITCCIECNKGKGSKQYKIGVQSPIGRYMMKTYGIENKINAYDWLENVSVSVVFKKYYKRKSDSESNMKDEFIRILAENNSVLIDKLTRGSIKAKDQIIELLQNNIKYYINLWGGDYYSMPAEDQIRCDELEKCIMEIKAL